MKFVRFDGGRTGLAVADGSQVLDIHASLAGLQAADAAAAHAIRQVLPMPQEQAWTAMIQRWDTVRQAFQALEGAAQSGMDLGLIIHPIAGVGLEAPLASPSIRIFAIASNTTQHIMNAMKTLLGVDLTVDDVTKPHRDNVPPLGFTVWPSVVVGPDAVVAPPRGTQTFDYEAECAVYVKAGGRYLEQVDLWGYTAFNDLGVRDSHLKLAKEAPSSVFSLNVPKNFDSGKSCGPWVTVDEGHDLGHLRCTLTVNGQTRQDWNLAEMIYGFNETLAFLSHNLTLLPGDMLASGTGAGVAVESGVDGPNWLRAGDVIEIKLEGAGVLRNIVGSW